MRRNEVIIDLSHSGSVKSNEPHRSSMKTIERPHVSFHLLHTTSRWSEILILPRDTAGDGLCSPPLDIREASGAPKNDWSDNPSPKHLPHDRRPPVRFTADQLLFEPNRERSNMFIVPLPSAALLVFLLHPRAGDFSARDAPCRMELPRNKEHENG